MPSARPRRSPFRWIAALLIAALLLGLAGATLVWWKVWRSVDQEFASAEERFNYGSLGAEALAGIPYPIFMILPRVFPDLVERHAREGYGPERAGHGGYGAFGLAWEEGQRLPIGLSIKRVGYERVTLNCALCHTTSWRVRADDNPRFAIGGATHTLNLQGLLRFLFAAANDRRFSATRLLPEIQLHFKLDAADLALYAFVLIPKTRIALQLAERELGWMNDKPSWGPGRDDAFNLPKYILARTPWDRTIGNTDFPPLWQMADRQGHALHAGGEADGLRAVIATSALGTGALPVGEFDERARWLAEFLHKLAPPPYPLPIDAVLADRGAPLFVEHCAACHAKDGARTGKVIPLDEIGTDPAHVETFTQADAERMNLVTRALGLDAPMRGAAGYVAKPLVGVWLLGPYLHNGAVPTVADLLEPPEDRPAVFWRGYDQIDPERLGFVATGAKAEANGFHFDTSLAGNGKGGHRYGTTLARPEKRALIEYLKRL